MSPRNIPKIRNKLKNEYRFHQILSIFDYPKTNEFDYNKLKVSELKSLAAAKKLEGYKSLKKGPLIELLKSSE